MFTLDACNIVMGITCLNGLQIRVYIRQQIPSEPMKQQEFWLYTCIVSSRNLIFTLCLVMV